MYHFFVLNVATVLGESLVINIRTELALGFTLCYI